MSFESFEHDLRALIEFLSLPEPPPPWWLHPLHQKLNRIETLLKRGFDKNGEQIMALVTIDQDDLDALAASFQAETAKVTSAATDLSNATGVLSGYIQQLLANQATPIPAADRTAIDQALADASSADSALSTATGNLTSLEPTVTPVSPTPVSPTPVSPTPVSPTPVSPTPVPPTPVSPTPVSPAPVSPSPVSPTPVSPGAVVVTPADPTQAPVQAGTLDPSTQVVEVPQGVVPVVVPTGAQPILAGSLPADAWVTPTA